MSGEDFYSEELSELRRLEMATAPATMPALADGPVGFDAEAVALREIWLTFGGLLEDVDQARQAAFDEAVVTKDSTRFRKAARRWIGQFVCGAALSLAAIVTLIVGLQADSSPIARKAAPSQDLSTDQPPSPWIDQLDEQIVAAGQFVYWLENEPSERGAKDDRALDSLLNHLDEMNTEASSGSL